jgi:hypothetical protein
MLATLVALGTIVLVHQADSNRVFCTLIGAADGVQVSFDFRKSAGR